LWDVWKLYFLIWNLSSFIVVLWPRLQQVLSVLICLALSIHQSLVLSIFIKWRDYLDFYQFLVKFRLFRKSGEAFQTWLENVLSSDWFFNYGVLFSLSWIEENYWSFLSSFSILNFVISNYQFSHQILAISLFFKSMN
jgi:hypothetical protein